MNNFPLDPLPGSKIKLPTSYMMRELYTACSVVPPMISVNGMNYPVDFNLDQIMADAVQVAGNINSVPGSLERFLMHIQAKGLYLLTNEMQVQITAALTRFVTGLFTIYTTHLLLNPNGDFKWRYFNKSEITFDIFLIRIA